jgi:hypothetical protein
MDDLVKKWERSGLLEDIDPTDKPLLSKYFEEVLNYWKIDIEHPAKENDPPHAISSFLLIRKIFHTKKDINIVEQIEDYLKFLNSPDALEIKYACDGYGIPDWDLEVMQIYVENISLEM